MNAPIHVSAIFYLSSLSGFADGAGMNGNENQSKSPEFAFAKSQQEAVIGERPTLTDPPSPPPGFSVMAQNPEVRRRSATDEERADLVRILESGVVSASPEALAEAVKQNPKYDDAEWHYGGDFPEGVPVSHAFTHIGFYLTWAAERDLVSDFIREEFSRDYEMTLSRKVSPIHLLEILDGSLVDDMLSDEGNALSRDYYAVDDENGYLNDFLSTFPDREAYRVAPTWKNYDRVKPTLDRRLEEWRKKSK